MNEVVLLQRFVKDNIMKNHLQEGKRKSMHGRERLKLIKFVKNKPWKLTKEVEGINRWMQNLGMNHINCILE